MGIHTSQCAPNISMPFGRHCIQSSYCPRKSWFHRQLPTFSGSSRIPLCQTNQRMLGKPARERGRVKTRVSWWEGVVVDEKVAWSWIFDFSDPKKVLYQLANEQAGQCIDTCRNTVTASPSVRDTTEWSTEEYGSRRRRSFGDGLDASHSKLRAEEDCHDHLPSS